MVQRIKVQSGQVIYEAVDPNFDINIDVAGRVNVSKELNIGNDPLASGIITTEDNTDLIISPGINGNIHLDTSGAGGIVLNNLVWPLISPTPGTYLGTTSLNTLDFLPFIISPTAPGDTMTSSQLDVFYGPDIIPGQQALGPNTLYQKVSSGNWKRISALDFTPVNKAGDTMLGNLILNADPNAALGAATKQYVDSVALGLQTRPAVEVATTGNLSAIYDNGIDGVGATLTSSTNGAFPAIDGITVSSIVLGMNGILVKDQIDPAQNGRYNLTQVGDALTPWILTRCSLCDTSLEIPGSYVFVKQGTLYSATGWVFIVADPETFVVGTDAITATQFSGAGTYIAGTGISITGTNISNIGVVSAIAGANISVSSSTGAVTFSVSGTVPSAFNLSGGSANQIPYQTASGLTTFSPVLNFNPSTGNLQSTLFTGSGAGLTSIPNGALVNSSVTVNGTTVSLGSSATVTAAAETLTGTALNSSITSSSLTGVGTLTSLSVSGNATFNGNLIKSVQTGISAAGSTLGTATVLTKDINVVSIVGVNEGVSLPGETQGLIIIVMNMGTNSLYVYPSSITAQIDSLGPGIAFNLPVGGKIMFMCVSLTQWYTLNATYL